MSSPAARETRHRHVVPFGAGNGSTATLGELGQGLMRIERLGLPVPPGFVLPADAYHSSLGSGGVAPEVWEEVVVELLDLEAAAATAGLADGGRLTVAVRPSPPPRARGVLPSFPELGLSRTVAAATAALEGTSAWRRYERLLRRWASGVHRLPAERIEAAAPAGHHPEDNAAALEALLAEEAAPLPEGLVDQVRQAVRAIFTGWASEAAERHRRLTGIAPDAGTGIVIQATVPLHRPGSGAGSVMSRNSLTGSPQPGGVYADGATGHSALGSDLGVAPVGVPAAFDEIRDALPLIEAEFRDVCEVDFLVSDARPWFTGIHHGERTSGAAVRIAVDLVDEGLIDVDEALARVPLSALARLQAPVVARDQTCEVLARGIAWLPGAAVGHVALAADTAVARAEAGEPVVLVCETIGPEELPAVLASTAFVTRNPDPGIMAATLGAAAGRPGLRETVPLEIDPEAGAARVEGGVLEDGAPVTVDGHKGLLLAGHARLVPPQPSARLARLLDWCDERGRIPIADAVPDGWTMVASVGDAARGGAARVLIDIDLLEPRSDALAEIARAACAAGATELGVRLGTMPRGGDVRLPPGPWRLVVAGAEATWAARLLSARAA